MCKYMFSRAGMGPRMRFACVCLYTFLDYLQLNNIARRSSEVCACVFPVSRKRCVCVVMGTFLFGKHVGICLCGLYSRLSKSAIAEDWNKCFSSCLWNFKTYFRFRYDYYSLFLPAPMNQLWSQLFTWFSL